MPEPSQNSKQRKHFQFSLKSLLGVFVVASVVLTFKKPMTIAYHLWSLDRTWQQVQENTSSPQVSSLMAAHRSHVNALIDLGHYEKKVFYIGHLEMFAESFALQKELLDFQTARPQRGEVSYSSNFSEATVFSSPSNMPQWSSIMASHNARNDKRLLPVKSVRLAK